jgi:hypothetical protein
VSGEKAEIEITASTARLPAALRAAAKMMQGFVAETTGILSKSDKRRDPDVSAIARGAAIGGVASSLAVRGMDLMVDQGKEFFNFQKELTRFGIAARQTPLQLQAIETATRKTSDEIGVSAIDVLRAGKSYMDLAGAQSFTIPKMNLLARAAQATGAQTTDLAGMMYQLTETMKLTDAQVEDTMGGLINQAKDGAIEAKDMAAEFAGILPLFARFKDSLGPSGAIQAGAMFQVIRKGFNSASEAGTGIQRVFAGLRTYASRFEKNGVKIWDVGPDGVKRARSISTIMKEISESNLVKDPELMKKAFGRTEGWRSMELLLENTKALADLEASGQVKGVIANDLAAYTDSAAGRIEIATERVKNAFAAMLTPERVDQIVAGFEHMTEAVGPLLETANRIADAFGLIYDMGKGARKVFSGGNEYKFSDAEIDTINAGSANRYNKFAEPSPAAIAARQRLLDKKAAYDKSIADITGAEKNDRPTNESIKRAIIAARSDMGPDKQTTGTGEAARAYLAERGDAIGESRYKKIEREIVGDQAAKQIQTAFKASIDQLGKTISDALARATTVVRVDGNPIAKAVDNATDRKRKP